MILYHGSNTRINSINLAMCRPYKDFGVETTEEWARFVMNNRNRTFDNNDLLSNHDNMAFLFRQYENEIIDFSTLLNGLIYKETSSQYSFHTEKSIKLLRKVEK